MASDLGSSPLSGAVTGARGWWWEGGGANPLTLSALLTLLRCPLLPQFLGLWLCPLRCASWKTTPLHFPSWRSTSSAVPRKALSMTTPSPVTMTGWPQCRHGEPRPATRYQAGGQLLPGASVHAVVAVGCSARDSTSHEMGKVRWLVTICCRGFVVRFLTSESSLSLPCTYREAQKLDFKQQWTACLLGSQ